MIKKLILLLIVILCAGYANAMLSEPAKISSCSCELVSNPISVYNSGKTDLLSISQSGSAAEFSTIFPQEFFLVTGETQQLESYLKFPCDSHGTYILTTTLITSSYQESINQEVSVKQCPNLDVYFETFTKSGCECATYEYVFYISNIGSFAESYDVGLTKLSEFSAVSSNPVILDPGETQQVHLFITPPCDKVGNISTHARIQSETAGFLAEAPLELQIRQCTPINESSQPAEQGSMQKIRTALSVTFLMLLLFLLLLLVFVTVKGTGDYYTKTKVEEPKITKKDKPMLQSIIHSKLFKIILVIALAILFVVLLVKIIGKITPMVPSLNQSTNNTINITLQPVVQQNITQETNQTLRPELNVKNIMKYLFYFWLGFLLLFIILLFRIKSLKKVEKTKSPVDKSRWKLLVAAVILIVLAYTAYVNRYEILKLATSIKEQAMLYIPYIILGVLLLVAGIFYLNKNHSSL